MPRVLNHVGTLVVLLVALSACGGTPEAAPSDDASRHNDPAIGAGIDDVRLWQDSLDSPDDLIPGLVKDGYRGSRLIHQLDEIYTGHDDTEARVGVIEDGRVTCFIGGGRYFQVVTGKADDDQTYLFGKGDCSRDRGDADQVLVMVPPTSTTPAQFRPVTPSAGSRRLAGVINAHLASERNEKLAQETLVPVARHAVAALERYRTAHGHYPKARGTAAMTRFLAAAGVPFFVGDRVGLYTFLPHAVDRQYRLCVESTKLHFFVYVGLDARTGPDAGDPADVYAPLPGRCATMEP